MIKIKFLGLRKSGRCDICSARLGHKGRPVIARIGALENWRDKQWSAAIAICKNCLRAWLEKMEG